jgi:hypothetical protein
MDKLPTKERLEKNFINEQRKAAYLSSLSEELKIRDHLHTVRQAKKKELNKRKDEETYTKHKAEKDAKTQMKEDITKHEK